MSNLNRLVGASPLLPCDGGRDETDRAGFWSLALQGGGSLGAFTWGVLDRLLEAGMTRFDVISGSSAGAVNAALLAAGLIDGDVDAARALLERFWRRASGAAPGSQMNRAWAAASQVFAPFWLNPFDINPLRQLLEAEVDFERLRAAPPFRLLLGATRVADGTLRLFREHEVTCEVLLASACLPQVHHAIVVDGEEFWDGGYVANPPLVPLVEMSRTPNLLVVQIIPQRSPGHLQSTSDISRRLDNLTFNASLQRDLDSLKALRSLALTGGPALARHPFAMADLHRIAAEDVISDLDRADPLNLDWSFLKGLRDAGRAAAETWMAERVAS